MSFNLKEIKKLTWNEVFQIWQENEGERKSWKKLAKERGYDSWADWRLNAYAIPFQMPQALWTLFEVENPAEFIANTFGGPFSAWKKNYYNGATTVKFSDLAQIPSLQENQSIKKIIDNYPEQTIILLLELNDGRRLVVEGMHRSSALAIMKEKNLPLPQKLKFAIGKLDLAELPDHKINKED